MTVKVDSERYAAYPADLVYKFLDILLQIFKAAFCINGVYLFLELFKSL